MEPACKKGKAVETTESKAIARAGSTRGKLAVLMDIPLDVLLEIFSSVHPRDLLHLSKTTKAFRAMLLQRSPASIWRAALETVPEFPPRPAEMSEPAYASLAFDGFCMACGGGGRVFHWALRVRLCGKCSKSELVQTLMGVTLHGRFCEVWNFVPWMIAKNYTGMLAPAFQRFTSELEPLQGEAREQYMQSKMEETTRIKEHAMALHSWKQCYDNGRQEDLQIVRLQRLNDIQLRLRDLGWKEATDYSRAVNWLTENDAVRVARPLTDKVWLNIKGKLERLMQSARRRKYKDMIDERVAECDHYDFIPPLSEVCAFDEIATILSQVEDEDQTERLEKALENLHETHGRFRQRGPHREENPWFRLERTSTDVSCGEAFAYGACDKRLHLSQLLAAKCWSDAHVLVSGGSVSQMYKDVNG